MKFIIINIPTLNPNILTVKLLLLLHALNIGDFLQLLCNHKKGHGCEKCSRENHRGSWSNNSWEISSKHSKDFDSYKIYLIEIFNENEKFLKIGKTFRTLKKRMEGKNKIPYNYSEIMIRNSKELYIEFRDSDSEVVSQQIFRDHLSAKVNSI